jgi:hypothetical protein
MRPARVSSLALLTAIMIWCESAAADLNIAASDGWHTWQIDEVGAASELCCFNWRQGFQSHNGCNLDGGRIAYGKKGDCAAARGQIQFFTLIRNGKPAKILALSSNCPVTSSVRISDHGVIPAAQNTAWFRGVIENSKLDQGIREEALIGLVQSNSDTAFDYIDSFLSDR